MEFGNMIFGNSRGEYPIKDRKIWQKEFMRLVYKIDNLFDEDYMCVYQGYENNTFKIFPYYWGDCTCGFDDYEFEEKHRDYCYQTELENRLLEKGWYYDEDGIITRPDLGFYKMESIRDSICEELCKKYNLSFPEGCLIHCTCDLNERFEEWLKEIGYPDGHKDDCLLMKPNFVYKPTNFQIQWYKYPLRDSYMNQDISFDEFEEIINNCISSLE